VNAERRFYRILLRGLEIFTEYCILKIRQPQKRRKFYEWTHQRLGSDFQTSAVEREKSK
jgi:hypothetical protein